MYRPVWAIRTGPIGYQYANCPLPGGTIKIGVSPHGNEVTRHRLVFQQENEAMPRLPTGERGDALSSRGETRCRLRCGELVIRRIRYSCKSLYTDDGVFVAILRRLKLDAMEH
ncbi:hypothetical protein BHM03_00036385 [Ensete ventricosum]|nr:hypothetical protein BHM03_00036385 [Ensete ventricosum]